MKLVCTLLVIVALTPAAVYANNETVVAEASGDAATELDPSGTKRFEAMTLDVYVNFDWGGLFYPSLEVGADFGLIPIADFVVISLGGRIEAGVCALCPLISLALPLDVFSWYVRPVGTVTLHFPPVREMVSGLDLYAGLGLGPAIYALSVSVQNDTASASFVEATFIISPYVGLRYSVLKSVFVLAELRGAFEFGNSQLVITDSNGRTYPYNSSTHSRGDVDFVLGLGYRF